MGLDLAAGLAAEELAGSARSLARQRRAEEMAAAPLPPVSPPRAAPTSASTTSTSDAEGAARQLGSVAQEAHEAIAATDPLLASARHSLASNAHPTPNPKPHPVPHPVPHPRPHPHPNQESAHSGQGDGAPSGTTREPHG